MFNELQGNQVSGNSQFGAAPARCSTLVQAPYHGLPHHLVAANPTARPAPPTIGTLFYNFRDSWKQKWGETFKLCLQKLNSALLSAGQSLLLY
jgi:hypothetical protein